LLAMLTMPVAAHAKWLEASSDHFVIYADDTPADIERFADQLERFHSAMAFLLRADQQRPSPSNRVTVFVVKNEREVRKLANDGPSYLYAFYQPRAGGSIAIVPAVQAKTGGTLDFSMIALLHEYAHHFQISTANFPQPRWLVEGSAEFFASARFDKDGAIMLGMPAEHRAGELFYAADVTATQLLDPDSYGNAEGKKYDAFYGKAWLLYHYLTFGGDRQGQLERYINLLQQGQTSAEAARAVFGDLDALEKDIEKYLKRPRLNVARLPASLLKPAVVTLRELSAGEAAIMPIRVRSQRGVSHKQALELLPEAQAIAARYPQDAAVLAALAEAEFDADNDDAAVKAADAAIALDPEQRRAYIQKGLALFNKAEKATNEVEAYRAARAPFVALNKLENDHPLPLLYYYLAFVKQGNRPSKLAIQALERALQLAPFDEGLRFMVVQQQINDKDYKHAAVNLAPLAYDPHGGKDSEVARRVLDRLTSGENLDGLDAGALFAPEPEIEASAQDEGGKAGAKDDTSNGRK